jgi:hypothetical protein
MNVVLAYAPPHHRKRSAYGTMRWAERHYVPHLVVSVLVIFVVLYYHAASQASWYAFAYSKPTTATRVRPASPAALLVHVTRVVLWEDSRTGHATTRYAVAEGSTALNLVQCMTYLPQENRAEVIEPVKATGSALICLDDGRSVAVTLARDYFYWNGPEGRLNPRFAKLCAALPWKPGLPPAGLTQPGTKKGTNKGTSTCRILVTGPELPSGE